MRAPVLRIRVRYVDGSTVIGPPESWVRSRPTGVDTIDVEDASGTVHIASASLYWLYPERDTWVIGWGSLRYDPNPLTEIVFDRQGQRERTRQYMPDFSSLDILKLGHFRPGTTEPDA